MSLSQACHIRVEMLLHLSKTFVLWSYNFPERTMCFLGKTIIIYETVYKECSSCKKNINIKRVTKLKIIMVTKSDEILSQMFD